MGGARQFAVTLGVAPHYAHRERKLKVGDLLMKSRASYALAAVFLIVAGLAMVQNDTQTKASTPQTAIILLAEATNATTIPPLLRVKTAVVGTDEECTIAKMTEDGHALTKAAGYADAVVRARTYADAEFYNRMTEDDAARYKEGTAFVDAIATARSEHVAQRWSEAAVLSFWHDTVTAETTRIAAINTAEIVETEMWAAAYAHWRRGVVVVPLKTEIVTSDSAKFVKVSYVWEAKVKFELAAQVENYEHKDNQLHLLA